MTKGNRESRMRARAERKMLEGSTNQGKFKNFLDLEKKENLLIIEINN